jgi:histidine triad (HIT) family protein
MVKKFEYKLAKEQIMKRTKLWIIAGIVLLGAGISFIVWKNNMAENNCIFCKIIARQIPATIVAENDDVIAIKDINPKAPTHLLIIPKKHIQDVQSIGVEDMYLTQYMFNLAQEIWNKDKQDFRLVINSGKNAGQVVFHLHMHYLAGGNLHTDL